MFLKLSTDQLIVSTGSRAQVHFFLCVGIQFDCSFFEVKNDFLQLHCFQITSLFSLIASFRTGAPLLAGLCLSKSISS